MTSQDKPSGLINRGPVDDDDEDETEAGTADDGEDSEGGAPADSVIAAAEQKIESQLTPKTRADYLRIVTAGMKAGLEGGPNSIIASLAKSKDPVKDCAIGAVNLVLILQKHARGTMPLNALVPAATTLMLKALEFADRMGVVKVDNDTVIKATRLIVNTLFARSGITAPMLHTAARNVHRMINDPGSLEKIKRAAGVVKDPNASEPTPLPGGGDAGTT